MRRPVVLVAIAFATVPLYLFTLTYLIAYAAILPAPRRWIAVFPNMRSGYLSWLFCAHLVAVTLASLPFAWSFARLYGRYTIAVLELTRFRGHLNVRFGGVHDGKNDDPVHAGV